MDLDIDTLFKVAGGTGGGGMLVGFLFSLNGRLKSLEKDVESQEQQIIGLQRDHGNLELKLSEELGNIRESLGRIEGRLLKDG